MGGSKIQVSKKSIIKEKNADVALALTK